MKLNVGRPSLTCTVLSYAKAMGFAWFCLEALTPWWSPASVSIVALQTGMFCLSISVCTQTML